MLEVGRQLKQIVFFFFTTILGLSSAYAGDDVDSAKVTSAFEIRNSETGHPIKVSVEALELDNNQQVQEQIKAAVDANPTATIVVSTDQASTISKLSTTLKPEQDVILAPFDLTQKQEPKVGFLNLVKNYPKYAKEKIMDDRIGFLLVSFTLANETFIWLHSTHLSQFERTSNVIYSVAVAMIFSIDKTTWARTVKPIKEFFRKNIGMASYKFDHPKELLLNFASNTALATALNLTRFSFTSVDAFIHGTLQLQMITYPLLVGLIGTAGSFSWSEHLSTINIDDAKTKFIFRRVYELRSVILGAFASSALLLHPDTYGWSSWAITASVGVVGLTTYINHQKITKFIENNKTINRIAERILPKSALTSRWCTSLFPL